MASKVTITLSATAVLVLHSTLEAQQVSTIAQARKVTAVVDAFENAYNVQDLESKRVEFIKKYNDAQLADREGKATTGQKEMLAQPFRTLQRNFYGELNFEHPDVSIECSKDALDAVKDLLDKLNFDGAGRRVLLEFCNAVQAAKD